MNEISAHELGSDGLKFIRGSLRKGGSLSSLVTLADDSVVWSYLPLAILDSKQVGEYQEGGVLNCDEASEVDRRVGEFIAQHLHEDVSNVALFEDQFFSIGDPAVSGEDDLFAYQGTLYHYRQPSAEALVKPADTVETISAASHYPLVILLTSLPSGRPLPRRAEIAEDVAAELATNVRHVIVGAYDEEGYVIASRKSGWAGGLR